MDCSSPDTHIEYTGELQQEDGSSVVGKLDCNVALSKYEAGSESYNPKSQAWNDGKTLEMRLDCQKPPMLPPDVNDNELKFNLVESAANNVEEHGVITQPGSLYDMESIICERNPKALGSPVGVESKNVQKEDLGFSASSGEMSSPIQDDPFHSKTEAEISSSRSRNYHGDLDGEDSDPQNQELPRPDEAVNGHSGDILGNSQFEGTEYIDQKINGENTDHHTEMSEYFDYSEKPLSDNEENAQGDSDHSFQRTQKRSVSPMSHMFASPVRSSYHQISAQEEMPSDMNDARKPPCSPSSPVRQKSVSSERSPQPYEQEEMQSPAKDARKSPYSPSSPRRKFSTSPERPESSRKRAFSPEHVTPSKRRRSYSPGKSPQRDSRHRSISPPSPKMRESTRKKGRSKSRSPSRRKDSSGHRRDHRGRSRSRSPYPRDRYRRSPRRRPSPRHRSPPRYYSRRHSPRRRPWSPPSNRNTGVGRPGKNLFVAGFSFVTSERDLEKKFSRFGRVTDVRIVRDRRTGDSRGFGFLSLERDEDADAAIRAIDQTEWNGRIVLVEKSKTSAR